MGSVAKEEMKKSLTYKLKISEDVAKKLSYVSENEGLSVQNMLSTLIRQKIQYFERVKGNIKPQMLQNVNLDDFASDEEQ